MLCRTPAFQPAARWICTHWTMLYCNREFQSFRDRPDLGLARRGPSPKSATMVAVFQPGMKSLLSGRRERVRRR